MIKVTRLNGVMYWLNPHMIETVESKPDTTVTLTGGKTLIVRETPEELLAEIVRYRHRLGQFGNER